MSLLGMNPVRLTRRQCEEEPARSGQDSHDAHEWPRTKLDLHEDMRPVSAYEQAFRRVRSEYEAMPGMRLTPPQVERLSGVERSVCKRVLDDLLRAKFLVIEHDGTYARCMSLSEAFPRRAKSNH